MVVVAVGGGQTQCKGIFLPLSLFFFGAMTSVATKLTEDPTLPPPYPFTPVTTRATHAWPREPVSAKHGLWRG